jgi:hypothetical protein
MLIHGYGLQSRAEIATRRGKSMPHDHAWNRHANAIIVSSDRHGKLGGISGLYNRLTSSLEKDSGKTCLLSLRGFLLTPAFAFQRVFSVSGQRSALRDLNLLQSFMIEVAISPISFRRTAGDTQSHMTYPRGARPFQDQQYDQAVSGATWPQSAMDRSQSRACTSSRMVAFDYPGCAP